MTEPPTAPGRSAQYEPLPATRAAHWSRFGKWEQRYFPNVVGLELDEVRVDYGGAIATLIDTVVVPAVGSAYDVFMNMLTIDLQIRYLGAAVRTDLVAEGWVNRRGRSILFCQAEVRAVDTGDVVAEGWLTYKVSAPRPGATNGAT